MSMQRASVILTTEEGLNELDGKQDIAQHFNTINIWVVVGIQCVFYNVSPSPSPPPFSTKFT